MTIEPKEKMGDTELYEIQGSAKDPYQIKRIGEVWSCNCPAWRNQSQPINKRTCKHIRKIRGDAAESERIGGSLVMKAAKTKGKVTAVPPALLLANKWTAEQDPTGWWMSEKLDGVRAYWDGEKLISRLGNQFYPPAWWTKDLPKDTTLDGELFIGRKKFQETVSVVRSQGLDKEWENITYLVFDIPAMKTEPFEDRVAAMKRTQLSGNTGKHVRYVEQTQCTGYEHLERELKRVQALGGEGIMLRQPGSLYEGVRSNTLLKVKTFLDDEAVVTGYQDGQGKHKGKMGAVLVTWNGKNFKLGTGFSDKERLAPPEVGSKVTFRYQELSKDGIPRFPVFAGPAIDK